MTWLKRPVLWTREEVDRLQVLFAYASPADLKKAFPSRTMQAIYAKASFHGFKRTLECAKKIQVEGGKKASANSKQSVNRLVACLREAGILLRKQQHEAALDIIERGLAKLPEFNKDIP